jgi:hypothetical protein
VHVIGMTLDPGWQLRRPAKGRSRASRVAFQTG